MEKVFSVRALKQKLELKVFRRWEVFGTEVYTWQILSRMISCLLSQLKQRLVKEPFPVTIIREGITDANLFVDVT